MFEDGEYDDDTGELDAERVDDDGKCTGEVDTGVAMLGEQESAILCIFFLCFWICKEVLIILASWSRES